MIRGMYNKYLMDVGTKIEYDPTKSRAVLCDIDGTLAEHHRKPHAYSELLTDTVIEPIRDVLNALTQGEFETLSGCSFDEWSSR